MHYISEIEVVELQQMLSDATSEVQLVDIRGPDETAEGMIPGAENLPLHLIPEQLPRLIKDKTIVIYCGIGASSPQACAYLESQGYRKIAVLRGGFLAWSASGLPVSKHIKYA